MATLMALHGLPTGLSRLRGQEPLPSCLCLGPSPVSTPRSIQGGGRDGGLGAVTQSQKWGQLKAEPATQQAGPRAKIVVFCCAQCAHFAQIFEGKNKDVNYTWVQ